MPENIYLEKNDVLWWAGFINNYGLKVLGPYCIKKQCRVELEPMIEVYADSPLICPSCREKYAIKKKDIEGIRVLVQKEYLALDRKGDKIKPLKLDKLKKDEIEVSSEDKFITIRAESNEGELKVVHVFIGDKYKQTKAHLIVDVLTGEIRVDHKEEDPKIHIKSLKSKIYKDKKPIVTSYKP